MRSETMALLSAVCAVGALTSIVLATTSLPTDLGIWGVCGFGAAIVMRWGFLKGHDDKKRHQQTPWRMTMLVWLVLWAGLTVDIVARFFGVLRHTP